MIDHGEAEREIVTMVFLIPVPRMPWWWGPRLQQQEVELAPAAAAAASGMSEIMSNSISYRYEELHLVRSRLYYV